MRAGTIYDLCQLSQILGSGWTGLANIGNGGKACRKRRGSGQMLHPLSPAVEAARAHMAASGWTYQPALPFQAEGGATR